MLSSSITGARYMLRGIGLLRRPGLKRYVLVPLAVNVLVFSLGIWLGAAFFERLMERMQASIPTWLGWLEWLLWPVFALALLVIVFYSFTLVANLLAAPFNGLLAEQAERHIRGQAIDKGPDWKALLRELPGALWDEVRKILYAVLWSLPFLLLALVVPVVGPLLWFLFSAWLLALQYVDFPMGNHGLKFRQMRATLRRQRPLGLGFGAAVAGLTMIPVVNFIVMPAAVVGATVMWVEGLDRAATSA